MKNHVKHIDDKAVLNTNRILFLKNTYICVQSIEMSK